MDRSQPLDGNGQAIRQPLPLDGADPLCRASPDMFAFASEFSRQRRQSDDSIEPLAILLAAPSIGTRDPEIGPRQFAGAQLAEESDDSVGGLAGCLVDPVEPLGHPVELVPHGLDTLVMLFVDGPGLAKFQRALEVSVDFLAIGLVGMQFQAKRT